MNDYYLREGFSAYYVAKREQGYNFEEKIMQEQKCRSILPFDIRRVDEESFYYFKISGYLSLYQNFQDKKKSVNDYKKMYQDIFQAVEELEDYLLPAEGILLESRNVFYDEKESRICFCYLPSRKTDLMQQLLDLTEELLEIMNYEDRDLVEYLYHVHGSISRGQLPNCQYEKEKDIESSIEDEEAILEIEDKETIFLEGEIESKQSDKWYIEIAISVFISAALMFFIGYQLVDIYQLGWRGEKGKILVFLTVTSVCNLVYLIRKVRLKSNPEKDTIILTDEESIDKIGEI